jgi:branched-chain amino acid transport system permease protein
VAELAVAAPRRHSLIADAFLRHRLSWSDALVWLVGILVYFVADEYLQLGTQTVIMIIFALSLDLAIGYAGIESLGHAVFFGTGAYAAGSYALYVSGEPISGLVAGGLAAGVLGILSGVLILRVRGLTQVILTLAIATMLLQVATTAKPITGGDDGLTGYKIAPILGQFTFDIYGHTAYLYGLAILAVVFLLCRILVNSPFGLTVRGIRDNPLRMRLLGVPVSARLLTMYTISGALAGVAGALSAQVTGLVGTDSLSFMLSGNVLIMLILGGIGRLSGAFLGATVFVVVSDRAAAVDPFNWLFVLGAILILAVRFTPSGLSVMFDRLVAQVLPKAWRT